MEQLHVHLGGVDQRVQFRADARLDDVLATVKNSKLTAFFKLCETDVFARTLLYLEVPKFFRWYSRDRKWRRRKKGAPHPEAAGIFATDTLGRMYTVKPRAGEAFFFRLLLHNVTGPKSYEDLRTVDGVVLASFKDACRERGLLDDGEHWAKAMEESAHTAPPASLRHLLALIIVEGNIECDALRLWTSYKEHMIDDIRHQRQQLDQSREYNVEMFEEALRRINKKVHHMCGRRIGDFGLPEPPEEPDPADPDEEHFGDIANQLEFVDRHEDHLTADQQDIYREVTQRLEEGTGGIIFVDAPGGCGKTFLENFLLAKVRSNGHTAIAVASTGIAACLLDGGTTAHYRFKIPLNLHPGVMVSARDRTRPPSSGCVA